MATVNIGTLADRAREAYGGAKRSLRYPCDSTNEDHAWQAAVIAIEGWRTIEARWIPVTERLPVPATDVTGIERHFEVIVAMRMMGPLHAGCDPIVRLGMYVGDGTWIVDDEDPTETKYPCEVVAWMPLPEGPWGER